MTGEPVVFADLPATGLAGGISGIWGIGLAHLVPRQGRRRPGVTFPPNDCLLPRIAHAHVHSIALDFAPMEEPTLNWPMELNALAGDPDLDGAVTRLQKRLTAFHDPRPQVRRWTVHSHGLIWRNGDRVPVSDTYERIHTVLPVVDLLAAHTDVATAYARCLADPAHDESAFLMTCVEQAAADEERLMLESVPETYLRSAVKALFGEVQVAPDQAMIISLAGRS